ncbi:MAG TPA: ADP-ribosylglycohydrolase family protein, partial [Anaerolineae bacterium]|nr:ADP-ribosylglycohydrolase family protein [Anaerolineae bacterium]
HALLHGEDDFQKSLMIVNTCGWDTDCNSGNVGCLLGIKNGLAGLEAGPDWRGPVADRLYLPTADGGRAISDAVTETYHIVNIGRALAGQEPLAPKGGARFHFGLPGSVQGFQAEESVEAKGAVTLENVEGHSRWGERSLAIHYHRLAPGRVARAASATFVPSQEIASYFDKRGYALLASSTLYAGQTVRAGLSADSHNEQPVLGTLYLRSYGPNDRLVMTRGPQVELAPGAYQELTWQIGDTDGAPIAEIGLEISSERRADGTVYLDYLTWDGPPNLVFSRPNHPGSMWRRAWVNGVDQYDERWPEAYRLVQNNGRGLLMQGSREWTDYQVGAAITPHLVKAAGIAARVQGLRRYYALLLTEDSKARLIKALDGEIVLAEMEFPWRFGETYEFHLQVKGQQLSAGIDGQTLFTVQDTARPLTGGGIALVCEEGRMATEAVTVRPVE